MGDSSSAVLAGRKDVSTVHAPFLGRLPVARDDASGESSDRQMTALSSFTVL